MKGLDFYKQFEKYKKVIVQEIINEFGEENKNIICERIDGNILVFMSSPSEEYDYVRNNSSINLLDKASVKMKYKNFEAIKNKICEPLMDGFIDTALYYMGLDKSYLKNEKLRELFTDENFNEGLIDSLTDKSMELLKNEKVPKSIRDNIRNNQAKFDKIVNELGIKVNGNFYYCIDEIIMIRDTYKYMYYKKILENDSFYISNLRKILNTSDYVKLFYISFVENTNHGNIKIGDNLIKYIYCPIARLKNQGIKSIDVQIVHELIHSIQGEEIDNLFNEINVQMHAINVVKRLHQNNVFVFDNENDYKITGECIYESLFPLTDKLLDQYGFIFDKCIFDGYGDMKNIFGEYWKKYLLQISHIYDVYLTKHIMLENNFKKVYEEIENMENFYCENNIKGDKHV